MMGLEFSFFNLEVIGKFIWNGLWFSVYLTIIATLGGLFFGTVLALMRLSGKKALMVPATFYVNGMRSIPLVMVILWFYLLVPLLTGKPIGAELSAIITFVDAHRTVGQHLHRTVPLGHIFHFNHYFSPMLNERWRSGLANA